ncbi:MAG: TolC family protein, partial [Flavobacteriaceae bacterium]|nr:TolC family protein [Flavobacteriaceae bacterium]
SKLNQEILTSGDFNPALLNDPAQIEDYATRIEVKQPLLNFDGLFARKAAKAKLEATHLQAQRTKEYMQLEVAKAYMQLQLAYKSVTVLEKAKEAALANKKMAENSLKQGYLTKADMLLVEVRVTEVLNQLAYAKSNIANASNYLSVLMNDKNYSIYEPTDTLLPLVVETEKSLVSEERADIKAMSYAQKAYQQMHRANKLKFLPRLNAFGTYELHDDEIFKGDANSYLFGAQLSWDILDGSKRFGMAKKSKAEHKKSVLAYEQYLSQSQVELQRTNRMLADAKNKLALTKLAMQQSEESLRIRTNRFKQG